MPGEAGLQRQLKTVLCDLDDCLYRAPEMPELVRENIQSELSPYPLCRLVEARPTCPLSGADRVVCRVKGICETSWVFRRTK